MNKQRRKLIKRAVAALEVVKEEVETIKADEEEAQEQNPVQEGDIYDASVEAVDSLEAAASCIDDAIERLEEIL